MADGAGMFTRMPVRRAIAAKGDTAFLAGPEMDPLGSDLYAFLALQPGRRDDGIDRKKMWADSSHGQSLFVQDVMDGCDGDRAFADGGSDALDVARADIAHGKYPGQACFEQVRLAGERPACVG